MPNSLKKPLIQAIKAFKLPKLEAYLATLENTTKPIKNDADFFSHIDLIIRYLAEQARPDIWEQEQAKRFIKLLKDTGYTFPEASRYNRPKK